MTALIAKLVLAYLLGSVVGSLLLGRLRGVDIRAHGSGNAGATNAMRTQGTGFALAVAAIDVGKGMLAAAVIAPLALFGPDAWPMQATMLACSLAAALGHCYPVWHGFRGGKGAGTLFGAIVVIFPWLALAMFMIWLATVVITGYVSLATLMAGAAFPLLLVVRDGFSLPGKLALGIAAAMLLFWTHRANLGRLRRGSEHRFHRARLFGRHRR